ncbi:hypothetical protein VNO80_19196 [Phaseolus coccineus]|uniref:Uncharacterized protein n=1 Tax=Phaseolus coccineus TaxID=3886 RepID=A0AAN9MFQ1_PHACN
MGNEVEVRDPRSAHSLWCISHGDFSFPYQDLHFRSLTDKFGISRWSGSGIRNGLSSPLLLELRIGRSLLNIVKFDGNVARPNTDSGPNIFVVSFAMGLEILKGSKLFSIVVYPEVCLNNSILAHGYDAS